MKIYVDADACPVKHIIETTAKQFQVPVTMVIDTSHQLQSDYSTIIQVSKAPDAVDLALINHCTKGDIVVTQDYGVASLALGKGCYALHPKGMEFTNENIDLLMYERHMAARNRRQGKSHGGKTKKRTSHDDNLFQQTFSNLLTRLTEI